MTARTSFVAYFKKFLAKHKLLLLFMCLFFFSHIGLTLYIPQLFKKFIDGVTNGLDTNAILLIALMYVASVFFVEVLNAPSSFFIQKLSWKLKISLRSDMLKNLLDLDMAFYHNNPVGELVENIETDVSVLSNSVASFVLDIVSSIVILVGILLIVFF